jgi:hypothetical protein
MVVEQDEEHLRLLTLFYYLYSGMVAIFACFPIIHLVIGVLMIANPGVFGSGKNAPPAFFGYVFAVLGGLFVLAGWFFAACSFFVARSLARRRHYMFCLILSGVNCMFVPFGTAIGVFTIIVLLRPAVKALFLQPAL